MNPIGWFVILVLMAAACALEVFLAKRKSRWPGLVLPICWLMPAWLVLPNLLLNALSLAENAGQMLLALLVVPVCLLPALVLLAIYWFCRRRRKSREQVEKMKIQDL